MAPPARSLPRRFVLSALLLVAALAGGLRAELLDTLVFGEAASEAAHGLGGELCDIQAGGLGEPSRRLLPGGPEPWQGGILRFKARVDPDRQNYFTLRLWGGDTNGNQMTLHVEGKQVGYRHLGDIEVLDTGTDAPCYPGRFYYRTCPLPLQLTRGKAAIDCEIRATGRISAYANTFERYQAPMAEPTRGLYRAYTHTDGYFSPPADEKQGVDPVNAPVRQAPGPEVIDEVKARVDRLVDDLLRDPRRPCNQMQALFLAKAWHTKWTRAAGNPAAIAKVRLSLDALYRGYVANPRLAEAEPSTYNPDWFGLGPAGQAIALLADELRPGFDETIDNGQGGRIKRRDGFRDMLVACRDWHRTHRRQYTNQSMINDLYGIYLANRGVAVLDGAAALPEAEARRYLYESVGLEPWLGSEVDGKPVKPLGESFFQTTRMGLTRELGFVGTYGEVLDWVCQIYDGTRPAPGQPGDPRIKAQLVRIAKARAPFRYPMVDADGFRAMVLETTVGWRDAHFPGSITYDQRATHDGSPFEVAAATLDPELIGYGRQMLEDNQFYQSLRMTLGQKGFRTTFGLLGVPGRHEVMKAQPAAKHRLPMSWDQPDFVFADAEDGVVAIKNGREILYASLYWRARHAVNFLGRVHHLTPTFGRIATVAVEIRYTSSGFEYTRPDWTNFGFGNGGPRYPRSYVSAHAGEKLPIAKVPAGIAFKPGGENLHAGRGDFYQLRYGPYWIGLNMSADKTFEMKAPDHPGRIRNLVTKSEVAPGSVANVSPQSTVVLHLEGEPIL